MDNDAQQPTKHFKESTMFAMNRNNTEAMKHDQGYIWAWYYGYGFMDDYGNYHEKYNRGYPKEF